jgi:phage shock protein PspC (stress-responsive transcriptional regulator)
MKKLYINDKDFRVAGICSGIADYFSTDPIFIRSLFLVCGFLIPGFILLYLIFWFLIPYKDDYYEE